MHSPIWRIFPPHYLISYNSHLCIYYRVHIHQCKMCDICTAVCDVCTAVCRSHTALHTLHIWIHDRCTFTLSHALDVWAPLHWTPGLHSSSPLQLYAGCPSCSLHTWWSRPLLLLLSAPATASFHVCVSGWSREELCPFPDRPAASSGGSAMTSSRHLRRPINSIRKVTHLLSPAPRILCRRRRPLHIPPQTAVWGPPASYAHGCDQWTACRLPPRGWGAGLRPEPGAP